MNADRTVRPLAPLDEPGAKLKRNPIPPPPRIAWLALDQLVIDEGYQRALSNNSRRLVRRLVERWDWNCYKPLSVAAAGDGRYEIIDGQHTAIAAATHGAVETLPCLVLDAATVASRAAAFVGINTDRIPLTPFAVYRARLAAEEPEAVAVDAGLRMAGADLVESLRYDVEYPPGTVACIATLLQIVRRGGKARLARLLKIAIAAEVGPVPSAVLKGMEQIVATPGMATDEELTTALASIGGEDLVDRAAARKRQGLAMNTNDAAAQVLLAAIAGEG
jgi:hypothetical protein